MDAAEIQQLTLARVVDPEGRDLFTLLGPAADRVKSAAARAGIALEPLAQFEPWFAGMMLSITALQQHGFDIAHGVEKIIEASASADRKPICAFETIDEQLALFDDMTLEQQQEMLLQSIDEVAGIESDMRRLLGAWRAGDEAAMVELLDEDFAEYPELADRMIYDRNARWAEQVSAMLKGSDDVLVVVGAAHLAGDRGLPALLEKRGFRVERN